MKHNRTAHGGLPLARTITQPFSKENYTPFWGPMRPGAEDALKIPSRMNNRLVYRDGREEKLA